MSYNGAGTFTINSAGQPVTAGTTITASAFNALTADLATGLSTAMCRDGQSTVTANLPMGGNKLTGLGAGTAATDSARLGQVQGGTASLLTVSGIDTITASGSPTVTAYATGQMFWFVASGTNTGAVTINIDSLGAKSITRGTTALAAADIVSGSVVLVVYDGTQFQLLSINRSVQVNGTIASASTTNIGAANAEYLAISGTTTITAFDSVPAGVYRAVQFAGILTLTHNGTSLILPGSASITTAAGDLAGFRSLGSGNWRCEWYTRATGQALIAPSAASESAQGIIEIATQSEANTGTDDVRVITPLKLANIAPTSVTLATADQFLILDASDSNKLKQVAVNGAGMLRAWVNFDGTGAVAIRASYNVSSITDNGVGDYTVNFTNAMPDANYGVCATGSDNNAGDRSLVMVAQATAPSTSAVRITSIQSNTASKADYQIIGVSIHR